MKILLALFLFVISGSSFACSCGIKNIDHDFEYYGYVFEGIAESIEVDSSQSIYQIDFSVTDKFKGNLSSSLKVQTLTTSAACGFNFELGQKYFVVASEFEFFTLIGKERKKADHPTVGSCGTTMKIEGNEKLYAEFKNRIKHYSQK